MWVVIVFEQQTFRPAAFVFVAVRFEPLLEDRVVRAVAVAAHEHFIFCVHQGAADELGAVFDLS